jgi:Leucine-rich repeat (LRR) protein
MKILIVRNLKEVFDMKIINLLVFVSVALMTSLAWAAPIDEGDLEVVEMLYARAGISMDKVKITENVNYLKVALFPSHRVVAYGKNNKKMRGLHVYSNEEGRVIYLKIYQGEEEKKLKDLSGISKLDQLEYLHLFNNNISDLTPLSKLVNLKGLDVSSNTVTSVKQLSGLVNLVYLDLNYQTITDLSYLSGLKNLEMIECEGCKLKSLSGLEGMRNLKYLTLYATESNSIEELRGLSNLIRIRMRIGDVKDFTPLANKLKLTHLRTGGGAGSNSNFMSTLIHLEELNMVENNFGYIPDLSEFKKLKELSLSGTKLKRIENLNSLSNLEVLRLARNPLLTKIEGLTGLASLKELDLKGSAINKMENLNLPNLEKLDISKTDIIKMENMGGMPNLVFLDMYDTKIKKIEGYLDAPNLIYVQTEYTREFSKNNKAAINFLDKRDKARYTWDSSKF